MKAKLNRFLLVLHSGYWFLPTVMALLAVALSFGMIVVDQHVHASTLKGYWWIYAGGHDGARAVLSTVAGSIMSVAGVTFSITIAALTLASQQFGPRLLRNFMNDRGNQVVLGTFIATFLYCLLVMRTVRGVDDNEFVPHLSVTLGVVLAMASVGVLIYFIHHIAASIQASNVIAKVAGELDAAIDRLFPEKVGHGAKADPGAAARELPAGFEQEARPIRAAGSGYVQTIDAGKLLQIAVANDLLLQVVARPGRFVTEGGHLARVWPGPDRDEAVARRIDAAFARGTERTLTQDVEFAVDQLVEVAVRALSPGINDPFTALQCLDWLGVALCRLAGRVLPSPYRYDDTGKLRVIADPTTFPGVVDAAFHQIRQYSRTSVAVTIRLLETLARVAACVERAEDRAALQRHAILIEAGSREASHQEADQQDIAARYQEVLEALARY